MHAQAYFHTSSTGSGADQGIRKRKRTTHLAILSAKVCGMWRLGMVEIGMWWSTAEGVEAITPYSLLKACRAAAALANFLLFPENHS